MSQHDRRAFLQRLSAVTAAGAAAPLGLNFSAITAASAQSAPTDYRALVNIFLYGGNDAYNTVLATDTPSWSTYQRQRQATGLSSSIALMPVGTPANPTAAGNAPERLGGVRAISRGQRVVHATRAFALHPALANVQSLYGSGRVAVLANVGPLLAPTPKSKWSDVTFAKPAKLFSHNDQQSTWQSFGVEGSMQGWAGLMADGLKSMNGSGHPSVNLIRNNLTCVNPSGTASVWLNGATVSPMRSDAIAISGVGHQGQIYGSTQLHTAVTRVLTQAATNNNLVKDHQAVVNRGIQISGLLNGTLPPFAQAPWGTPGVGSPWNDTDKLAYTSPVDGIRRINQLAIQLQMVARMIDANRAGGLAIKRQFFMVGLGGFDTHDNQIAAQAERMAQLDHALGYFDTVLGAMPAGDMRNNVTTFTASDFGRSFTNNGDGTDHGWGGHHFIMGGAVNGTEVYGTFPAYGGFDGNGVFVASDDQIQNGVLLPTTSVDHYAYTLGRWMGVPDGTLVNANNALSILPNLVNFPSNGRDLGFMKA